MGYWIVFPDLSMSFTIFLLNPANEASIVFPLELVNVLADVDEMKKKEVRIKNTVLIMLFIRAVVTLECKDGIRMNEFFNY